MSRRDLMVLRLALIRLLDFLQEVRKDKPPYFCKLLHTMVNNIEICALSNYEDWERLVTKLECDWKSAYYGFMGISAFHEVIEEQRRGIDYSFEYVQLIASIRLYFPD